MIKLFNFLLTPWRWLKPTLEGDDNKSSARRITAFVICVLYFYGHYKIFQISTDFDVLFKVLILDALFILVLFGIITVQNLIMLFKIKNNIKVDDTSEDPLLKS